MNFRIHGLPSAEFQQYFGLPQAELERLGIQRIVVDERPGFPDRIELVEAEVGQTVLLLNHVSQPAPTPYRASHAIYVREGATDTYDAIDRVPDSLRIRLLSLRGYDAGGMMVDADVVDGAAIEGLIARLFADARIATIHVHNARRGCYAARIERA